MNTEIKNLLEGEIVVELEQLSDCSTAEERERAIQSVEKLYKLKLEEDKLKIDLQKQKREVKDSKIEKGLKYGIMTLELLVPIIAYTMWYRTGLRFEETGTITSPMTRNLLNKMFPRR